jgi:subtilisin family serine protease
MSHGGAPTQAWADAVNAAYERGTAMFAAESDFFSLVPEPFRPNGLILPASPVYPAAFRRVIGVTGATADKKSYARNSLPHLLRAPWKLFSWMARGSYGADGTSSVIYRPSRKADSSETWRLGQLRPYPIAAYSPNIPWLSVEGDSGESSTTAIDLDGGGTSAATPQVAAAAALWLQKHRGEFNCYEWSHWPKAEAVYYALLKSADRQGRLRPDSYLGAGLLRADDALKISYDEIKEAKRPKGIGPHSVIPDGSLWFERAPNDYFDGARSLYALLGLQTLHPPEPICRADLWQKKVAGETRSEALQRLYYNMLLLKEWHRGAIPRKGAEADRFWREAKRDVRRVQNRSLRNAPPVL